MLIGLGAVGVASFHPPGWQKWVWFYFAISFWAVGHEVTKDSFTFWKRPNGTHLCLRWLLFAPYLLADHIAFRLTIFCSREAPFNEILPNVYLGRRLTQTEWVKHEYIGWMSVLDLAAEFTEILGFRSLENYLSMPVLDGTAPTDAQLRAAVEWIGQKRKEGPVYVHCALGHGRSACIVAACLIAAGKCSNVAEAESHIRSIRPGVRLHHCQRNAVESVFP